jgi:hypothetical protein
MKSLASITNIEKAFYDLSKMDFRLQEFFFTYYSQKLILTNHFYPHIESINPGLSDHGPDHIQRVLKLHEKLLERNIPALSDVELVADNALNIYELYILLCSTAWHDVGNLLGREGHNTKVVEVANRLETNFFIDDFTKDCVMQLSKAHSGPDGIRVHVPVEDVSYKNQEINLRFLAASLRFADELDEGEVRVDEEYYHAMKDKIPNESRIYWEAPCCIKRIEPKASDCVIEIHARVKKDELFKILLKSGKNVALIDELIYRIDKMNRERMYYMEFVRKHAEYREIIFDLTIQDTKPRQITFRFNNTQGYNEFWGVNTEINPAAKIPTYQLQKEEQ